MAYTKTAWVNRNTPAINAENLNKIENGIFNAHQDITNLSDRVDTAESDIGQITNSLTTLEDYDLDTRVTTLENDKTEWAMVNTDTQLNLNHYLFVDTTTNIVNLTLPETPSIGDTIKVVDVASNFETNNCNVLRNTTSNENIMGVADDLSLNINNQSIELVYSGNSTFGWRIVNKT